MAAINISALLLAVLSGYGARAAIAAGGEGRSDQRTALRNAFFPHRIGGTGAWSSRGCELFSRNHSHVACQCNHITSFAVLMDISKREVGDVRLVVFEGFGFQGLWFRAWALKVTQSVVSRWISCCSMSGPRCPSPDSARRLVCSEELHTWPVPGVAGNAELPQAALQSREQDKDYKHMVVLAPLDTGSI